MSFGLVGSVSSRVTEYAHDISCIDTGYIRPRLAACYLVLQDGVAGLVETGTAHSLETILAVLKYKQIPPENVHYVMPTHVHLDHAGGAGQLMQVLPNARLVVHPRGARHMIDPSKLWQGTLAVYGEESMHRMYGELLAVDESRVQIAEDGLRLDLNGRELLFLDTPGHARHHYSIYDGHSGGFFTGDTFGMAYHELSAAQMPYIMPTTTPVQFDPEAWYATLDRYLSYQPERMYLTHFGMVENVPILAELLRGRIAEYVDIANKYAGKDKARDLMKAAICEKTLLQLKAMDCPLPAPTCKGMLEMDFELNAQGLEIWVNKQASG